jgi:hypothetical protein
MSYLVRKIERNKWLVEDDTTHANSDILSKCLNTDNNELSVWRIASKELLADGLVAMVSGQDHIQKVHVVVLEEAELIKRQIEIEETPGKAASEEFSNTHRDLSKLTTKSLLAISDLIVEEIKNKANIHLFTAGTLKEMLSVAVKAGRIDVEKLAIDVRKKVDPDFAATLQ